MNPPPLAVYIHWPYCARICPYCDFNVVRDRGQSEQAALVAAIRRDLTAQAALIGPRRLTSIFFGGGTPSLMDPLWVADLIETTRALWPSDQTLEVSLEANPTDAEADRFSALEAAGVERLSLGVQALDGASLDFLGRNHGVQEARRAARLAGRTFSRLSIDLIYALPGQTPKGWTEQLSAGLDLGADHVSPYQLTVEPGTAFDRAVRRKAFTPPDDEVAAELFEVTQSVLEARGFDAYEVSNHARGEAARSRHNISYWRGDDYVGVGPGAHGRLTLNGSRIATFAEPNVGTYIRKVDEIGTGFAEREVLKPRDQALERLLMGLRITDGVGWDEVAALELTLDTPRVKTFVEQNLLRADSSGLAATTRGRRVLDRLIAELAGAGQA